MKKLLLSLLVTSLCISASSLYAQDLVQDANQTFVSIVQGLSQRQTIDMTKPFQGNTTITILGSGASAGSTTGAVAIDMTMHVSYKGVAVTPTNPIPTMQADFALVGAMGGLMASDYNPISGTALVDIKGGFKIVKGIMYGNISTMNIDVRSFGSDYQDFADAMVIPKNNPDVWFMIGSTKKGIKGMESQIYDAIIKQATNDTKIIDLLTAYPIWSVVSNSGSTIYVQPNVFNIVLIANKLDPSVGKKKSFNKKSKKDTSLSEIDDMLKQLTTSINPLTQTMTMSINTGGFAGTGVMTPKNMSLHLFYNDLEDTVMHSKMYGSLNATIVSPTSQTISIQGGGYDDGQNGASGSLYISSDNTMSTLEISPVINKPKKVRVTSVPKKFSFDDYIPSY